MLSSPTFMFGFLAYKLINFCVKCYLCAMQCNVILLPVSGEILKIKCNFHHITETLRRNDPVMFATNHREARGAGSNLKVRESVSAFRQKIFQETASMNKGNDLFCHIRDLQELFEISNGISSQDFISMADKRRL